MKATELPGVAAVQGSSWVRWARHAAISSLLVLALGCGDGVQTTTVRGVITFNGTPVSRGVINFKMPGVRPTGGPIQSDGTYEVELQPGEYQVLVDGPPAVPENYELGDKLGPRAVPEKFASFEESGLSATIGDESPQALDFSLP